MKSFIVPAGKIYSSEQDRRSFDNNASKKEQGEKGMVFSNTKRVFDFSNSCLYLSIGEVLCGQ